jgi:hypothetical protein
MNLRSFATFGAITLIARISPVLVVLGAAVVYAPNDFGRIAAAITALTLMISIGDSGLDSSASLISGQGSFAHGEIIASLISARLTIALVAAATLGPVLLASPLHGSSAYVYTVFGYALALVATSYSASMRISERIQKTGREPRLLLIEKTLATGVFLVVLVWHPVWAWVPLCYAIACTMGAIVSIAAARALFLPRHDLLGRLLRTARLFFLTAISANVVWRFPVLVLDWHGDHADAGRVAIAIYPVQAFGMAAIAAAPLLLLSRSGGLAFVQENVRRMAIVGIGLTTVAELAVAVLALSPPIGDLTQRPTLVVVSIALLSVPFLFVNPIVGAAVRLIPDILHSALAAVGSAVLCVGVCLSKPSAVSSAVALVMAEAFVLVVLVRRLGGRALADSKRTH